MSKFFCDSNCELDHKILDKYGARLIKMPYTVNGQEDFFDNFKSGGTKAFFDKMRDGASVKTQALNSNDYIEYFEPVLKSGDDIFYVTFSHKMSATFMSMNIAIEHLKKKYPERTVTAVDSKSISMGAGIIVYLTLKYHAEGKTDEEAKKYTEKIREEVGLYFTVSDLAYLRRGGRLSAFKAAMGTILNMKPIISAVEGALSGIGSVKGRKKAIHTLFEKLETDGADFSKPVVIIHADSEEEGTALLNMIKERYPEADVWFQEIGPVVGSHCGPDTLGLIFMKNIGN